MLWLAFSGLGPGLALGGGLGWPSAYPGFGLGFLSRLRHPTCAVTGLLGGHWAIHQDDFDAFTSQGVGSLRGKGIGCGAEI